MQDKNQLARYSGVLSEAVQESAAVTGKTAPPIAPEFNLKTSAGGRGYVSWYFSNIMQRHDFGNYITKTLAADFACALASWLRDGKPRGESQAAPAAVAAPDGWKLVPIQVPSSAFLWVSGGYSADYNASDPRDQKVIDERAQSTWENILDSISPPALAATPAAAPVVLPDPAVIAISKHESATKGTVEFTWGIDAFKVEGPHALFTEQQVRALMAGVAAPAAYSLDADPAGIRARAADAITGALALGAQNSSPPPKEHWLEPFWTMARAERLGSPQAQADARDAERWRAAREGVKSGDRVIHVYTAQHGLGTKLLGSAADAEIDAAIAAAKGE